MNMMFNAKIKKAVLAGMTMVMAMTMLAGCGSSNGGKDAASLKGKELKIGTGIYAPFAFKDESGNLVGFDVDLIEALSKKLGFTYTITATEYDNMFMSVTNKEYDIGMGQVCITDERKKKMDFTEPYEQAGLQFVVKKDSGITTIDQLKGKKIAVEKATAAHKYVTDNCKDSEIVIFPAIAPAFLEVEQGRADAMMQDKPNAAYYIKKHPDSGLVLLGDETAKIPDGFALPKDSPYKAELDKALKELQEDGTIKKLEDKWLNV
ncbi:MAG: ABC transporter substrate-binding protein [Megasphaera sp.]|jgi:ABC-type amino acid transport substrate-binding protein|nr:ABC transporter substrate-binding protein [Megasphaera sp.]MCH4188521.1 ABC transporter substrate-binding protein [Megasphaera sp.]MCH4218368.1 ABC transporter substrate-binding protein [Megasphaera sp.]